MGRTLPPRPTGVKTWVPGAGVCGKEAEGLGAVCRCWVPATCPGPHRQSEKAQPSTAWDLRWGQAQRRGPRLLGASGGACTAAGEAPAASPQLPGWPGRAEAGRRGRRRRQRGRSCSVGRRGHHHRCRQPLVTPFLVTCSHSLSE